MENNLKKLIDNWIEGWNEKNINKIMENYSKSAELFDPKIKEAFPEKLTLTGEDELKKYFKIILSLYPKLKIKPRGLWLKGDYEALLEYDIYTDEDRKIDVISKFYFSKDKKIQGHFVYYGLSYQEVREGKEKVNEN
ncbi:MAG: hypothetical protein DSY59_02585 [Persephonella sp.]|nr:MAG: hypothetical protein DSY59_02585 [Persephonella sp.]